MQVAQLATLHPATKLTPARRLRPVSSSSRPWIRQRNRTASRMLMFDTVPVGEPPLAPYVKSESCSGSATNLRVCCECGTVSWHSKTKTMDRRFELSGYRRSPGSQLGIRGVSENFFQSKSRKSKTPLETSRFSRRKKTEWRGGSPPLRHPICCSHVRTASTISSRLRVTTAFITCFRSP